MKKKFSLWLNIATICLCICAIAVGVYSAQNATLNVTGQVGFKAHNCEMVMTNYTIANSSRTEGATAVSSFSNYLPSGSSDDDLTDFPTAGITIKDTVAFNMGKFYFVDDTEQNKVPDIVITFTIRNESAFKVTATITENISKNENTKDKIELVDFTSTKGFDKKGETNATRDIVLTLRLKDTTIETLSLENIELFSIEFKKDDNAQIHNQGEYYVENGRLYVEYGYYPTTDVDYVFTAVESNGTSTHTTIYGENLGKPIRWVAYSGSNTTLDFTNIQEVPTGTFYFVSEYVLTPGVKFNTTTNSPVKGKNPNDYATSEIREYIKGDFVNEYGLSALVTNADSRTLPTENIEEYDIIGEGDDSFIGSCGTPDSSYLPGYIVNNIATTISDCNDSIWLLGDKEYSSVVTVLGRVAYYPSQLDQIYSSSPTEYGVGWWQRSPAGGFVNTTSTLSLTSVPILRGPISSTTGDTYDLVDCVTYNGKNTYQKVNSTSIGIRPGFQITISN